MEVIHESEINQTTIQHFISIIHPLIPISGTGKNGSVLAVKKSKSTVSSNAPLPEGCEILEIEWYWQTFVDGVLVSEEYLFSTNEIVCGGSGGGGSSGSGNTPLLNNPCDSVAKLDSNAEFKAKLDTLKNKANSSNREFCYVYKNTTINNIEETMSSGDENSLATNYSLGQSEKIDGLMHNHFFVEGRSVSIFSDSDLSDLILLFKDSNILDPYKFTLTLANQHGRQYMLKINDLAKFATFAQLYQSKIIMMSALKFYNIKPDKAGEDFSDVNESNFLQFLD